MEMNEKLLYEIAQMRTELKNLRLAQEQTRNDSEQLRTTLDLILSDNEQRKTMLLDILTGCGQAREMIGELMETAKEREPEVEPEVDPKVLLELTTRQHVILQLVLESKPYRAIAKRLHISENTIKTQAKTIHKKLKTTNRPELFMKASRMLRLISAQDYQDVIGIPKDWAKVYADMTCEEDPYSELYKQSRGTNDDKENS